MILDLVSFADAELSDCWGHPLEIGRQVGASLVLDDEQLDGPARNVLRVVPDSGSWNMANVHYMPDGTLAAQLDSGT